MPGPASNLKKRDRAPGLARAAPDAGGPRRAPPPPPSPFPVIFPDAGFPMLSEEHQQLMLAYLSSLRRGPRLQTPGDLAALSAHELLTLARKVDDSALGLFIHLLKQSGDGTSVFERLMGDHEEHNRPLVDAFFARYCNCVLGDASAEPSFNPLEVYLPAHSLDDLAFVQSRQPFFLRQTAATINAYLDALFGGAHAFPAGAQAEAWSYFWDRVIAR